MSFSTVFRNLSRVVILVVVSSVYGMDGRILLRDSVQRAAARVQPSLVKINVVASNHQGGREIRMMGTGSGVIITREGHLITNHHVAGRGTRIVCVLASQEEIPAELVGTDPLTDIAVLKLVPKMTRQFIPARMGNSDLVKAGDTVIALGSPLSLSQVVTEGVVSNPRLVLPGPVSAAFTMEGEQVGSLVRWIGHDAAIYPGNSGGPLINLRGEVVGINELSYGLGAAIPSNLAHAVAKELIAKGAVTRAWLGLEVQPLLKQQTGVRGVLVNTVMRDSPAAAAGLETGDIVTWLDGQTVDVRFAEDLPVFNQLVSSLPVGKEIEIRYLRNGQMNKTTLKTARREPRMLQMVELRAWGISVAEVNRLIEREWKLSGQTGVIVTGVRPTGPSGMAKPVLQERDRITAVNGQVVSNAAVLAQITEELLVGKSEPVPVLVEFDRRAEKLLTVVRLGARTREDVALEAEKAWLPVALQAVTREMATQLGQPRLQGVRVTQVYDHETMTNEAVRVGDIITMLDGEPVVVQQAGDEELFWSAIRQYRIGAEVKLGIIRGKESLVATVKLVAAPKRERQMRKYEDPNFEFSVRDLTFFDRVSERWPKDQAGVLVTEVKPGGWASLARLAPGDLVVSVDHEPVHDVAQLEARMSQIAMAKPTWIVMRIQRGIHNALLEFEPVWNNLPTVRKAEKNHK